MRISDWSSDVCSSDLNNNIEGRGLAISKAIDIVDSGLKVSVDLEAGGELAKNLVATYDLIIRNLLLANLNADSDKLDLAERLLTDIGSAWSEAVDPVREEAITDYTRYEERHVQRRGDSKERKE